MERVEVIDVGHDEKEKCATATDRECNERGKDVPLLYTFVHERTERTHTPWRHATSMSITDITKGATPQNRGQRILGFVEGHIPFIEISAGRPRRIWDTCLLRLPKGSQQDGADFGQQSAPSCWLGENPRYALDFDEGQHFLHVVRSDKVDVTLQTEGCNLVYP